MSDRFTQKLEQQRRKTRWRITGVVAALLVVAFGFWLVFFSSVFAISEVKVSGTDHLTPEQVIQAAEVPIGEPLVRLDTDEVVKKVEQLLIVESAKVDRELPHTVLISVKERSAVAWLEKGGSAWAVDGTGVIYRQLASKPSHIPQLKVDAQDRRTVAAAARVAADISGAGSVLAKQVQAISAQSRDSIELDLTKDRTVFWGSAQDSATKLTVLEALLNTKARTYDVSAPESPTTAES
ncbi:MAG TPA: FtsQ-type POTRA domain-containing protein [Aeromicrobium sp.]|nr:FtsQ-type POTRA domain-containing protein [Aeromicrobium sp.]